jgi:Circadian oscillating protein COP23
MQFCNVNSTKAFALFVFWTISSLMVVTQIPVEAGRLYIFECQQNPGTGVLATVVKKRSNGKTREVILWKSNYVPKPIQKTCRDVSDRFQEFWDKGNLDRLVISRADRNGGVIVCGFADRISNPVCDERHKIFTLSGAMSPQTAYDNLLRNLTNKIEIPIYQGSDDEIIIDFKAAIEQRPANR